MADLDRIKADIREIADRPKAVRFEEIERIVSQLGLVGYDVKARAATHGMLFRVGKRHPFMVSHHKPGDSHIRPVYVRAFLDAMTDLGLLDQE